MKNRARMRLGRKRKKREVQWAKVADFGPDGVPLGDVVEALTPKKKVKES